MWGGMGRQWTTASVMAELKVPADSWGMAQTSQGYESCRSQAVAGMLGVGGVGNV